MQTIHLHYFSNNYTMCKLIQTNCDQVYPTIHKMCPLLLKCICASSPTPHFTIDLIPFLHFLKKIFCVSIISIDQSYQLPTPGYFPHSIYKPLLWQIPQCSLNLSLLRLDWCFCINIFLFVLSLLVSDRGCSIIDWLYRADVYNYYIYMCWGEVL
jgi:hypothetical protein